VCSREGLKWKVYHDDADGEPAVVEFDNWLDAIKFYYLQLGAHGVYIAKIFYVRQKGRAFCI